MQYDRHKCKEKKTFIVSLFISVQIPSNFVCTRDIYIKNTKLYIYNEFCLPLVMFENKNAFWETICEEQSDKVW